MLIIWIVILVGLFLIFKGKLNIGDRQDSPINILKTRYANGEISKEEFEQMKKDLN
ncbi:MAG: SHOCT domain-containing protein [Candidatus Cloacimonetes bacterium]|nr:SHOCT domain-containing protein [Candidatus Cloacimonadota bacterium]MCF7815134.1 SHOCT domain-containing protein [Candidatus Cloacimonadota bacterium]MCF7869162.1 SHOCT domain-containing protein [Candidatus Cloacimonadota bacterium]MCF7884602.1 SHOCT domain-containing protein [Candidatus Cloacimonadota bacterium]